MTASGLKESNSFNPFATGNADSIRELLASQLGDQTSSDANGVFRDRAVGLIGTLTPVLVYMRDEMGLPINIQRIRFSLELRSIWMVAVKKIFLSRDSENGEVSEIPVPKMPEDILYPLQAYLGELPGYDSTVPYNKQSGDMPSQQHGFALMYFTGIFQQLSTSLGHIFKVETSDIDMRDVVLNRRIVVVNLPALENSDATLASLGRIVVASLRAMMAQMLGARLEGDAAEIFSLKPGSGDWPFHIAFDEIGYYATSGMDRMYAMGRGLNMMFWSAFQEVSGVWAKLGEKTQSLLGNANLTIAMRQQDANRTREWLEKTAGQTYVTQATSYTGGSVGQYRESQSAELRQVSRIDWADLQRLIEGEAIILFGGRRVYAKLFHAKVDTSGPTRLNRSLMLAAPQRTDLEEPSKIIDFIAEALRSGGLCYSVASSTPTEADAMATAFSAGIADGLDLMSCARKAVEAVLSAPKQSASVVAAAATEPPVTDLLPMLQASIYFANCNSDLAPLSGAPIRIAKDRLDIISAIETASGRPATEARRNAIDIEKLIAANGTPECRSKNETMTSVPLQ